MILYKAFPQRGNAIKGRYGGDWNRQTETGYFLAPWPAFLDSSLRWNDDEWRTGGSPSRQAPFVITAKEGSKNNINGLPACFYAFVVIPAKAGIQWFRQSITAWR